MNIHPGIAQAKAALNKNLAVTQSKLAKCISERDTAKAQIQIAVDRAEAAERSARDVERDLKKANALLHAFLTNCEAKTERFRIALEKITAENNLSPSTACQIARDALGAGQPIREPR